MSPPFTQVDGQNKTNKNSHPGLPLNPLPQQSTSLESPLTLSLAPTSYSSGPHRLSPAFELPHSPFLHLQPCPILNPATCIPISPSTHSKLPGFPTVKPWLTLSMVSFTVYDPNLPSTIICHYLLLHPHPHQPARALISRGLPAL